MAFLLKLIFFITATLVIYVGIKINSLFVVPPLPHLEETWWGAGDFKPVDTSIKPFKIKVPEEVIADLQLRLNNARPFQKSLEGIQQQYGINAELLSEIVEFWKTKYDWRSREVELNKYPQFKTNVQGLDIHYIHVKPKTVDKNVRVLPLLLLHGWPGSVVEFYKLIPKLTTPQKGKNFVFEVIVPSLPGYGFSEGASKPGMGAAQIAVIFKNLMKRIGFEKFYVHGGDWGAMIVTYMATLHPEHVLGLHSNMCFSDSPMANFKLFFGSLYPALVIEKQREHKLYPLSSLLSFLMLETGYMHLQATKPDTVGVGLNDSPVGLAAYIIEKFTTWTKREWKDRMDGGLKEKFTYDELLDNVMVYWVTNSITTSMRVYSENFSTKHSSLNLDKIPVKVPSACARFENELTYIPDSLLAYKYSNLVYTSDYSDGGHFAAFELPDVMAKDIWTAITKMEELNKQN